MPQTEDAGSASWVERLLIREYEHADFDAVQRLHVAALEHVGAYAGRGPWDSDLEDIVGSYLAAGGTFLVGVVDGTLVAMGALRRLAPDTAELKRMRVDPAWQGRGLGQQMLRALQAKGRELGFRTIELETSVVQVAAQHLYIRSGYLETGRAVLKGFDCILFRKEL